MKSRTVSSLKPSAPPSPLSRAAARVLVWFYSFWKGRLGLRGAGVVLACALPHCRGLQQFPLVLPNGATVDLDFTELSAAGWLHTAMGIQGQEHGLIRFLRIRTGPQTVLWDVGANAGCLSYDVVSHAPPAELRFFEPNPLMYRWVSQALAPYAFASGCPYALSNHDGGANLRVPPGRSAYGSMTSEAAGPEETFRIDARRGDGLIAENHWRPPTLIKIDTEGHDFEVMEGLAQTITQGMPIIAFEQLSSDEPTLPAFIRELPYELVTVSDRDGSALPGFHPGAGHNCALLPR